MKRIMLAGSTILFALLLTTGTVVHPQQPQTGTKPRDFGKYETGKIEVGKIWNPTFEAPRDVPVEITNGQRRAIKLESLAPEDQERVRLVTQASQTCLHPNPILYPTQMHVKLHQKRSQK
jgi:hypothetical protein